MKYILICPECESQNIEEINDREFECECGNIFYQLEAEYLEED